MAIGDSKTSGIWNRFVGKGSVQKQTYSETQVGHHLQLTHYGWMGWRGGLWEPDDIKMNVIFTPANLTRYVRGPKEGQMKGPAFHFGPPVDGNIYRYEEDLIEWLSAAQRGFFPRMYPSFFGKLDCDNCRFSEVCYRDKKPETVPDYVPTGGEVW